MTVPLWAEVVTGVLAVAGAAIALLGAVGLLRLRSFFERVHAPTLGATMGSWLILWANVLYFSLHDGGLTLHALILAALLSIGFPITTIFLMRAALFRARQSGAADVPPSLSAQLSDKYRRE
ncbi:monovalent cation/H(+) antiporter subunit G [Xylophilus sp.]|uniref:monovalent cation/H(+) antiporter subunit G n=1 Tax=Xylophilus sp. TaxID=2653893 RepID=UPI0013B749EA|nr:monovalent cation/H(+) antiporter subunit G [Xylophilus sp.]KAF1046108.1 MAG: Na(+)/H(+) antiporter subunit G1 [Xylophilus sp.]